MSESEARAHATFTALMWALSHPGRAHSLPGAGLHAFVAIAKSLVDLETSYYTPDAALALQLARTGARSRPSDVALYQFYPRVGESDLEGLKAAPVGSYAYPDESATLVVGCTLGAGQRLRLSGPGVQGFVMVKVGGLPAAFWGQRAEAIRYPLGWDLCLVANDQVIGIPRTTVVEVL